MDIIEKIRKRKWVIKSFTSLKFPVKRNIIKRLRLRKKFYPTKETNADIKNLIYCMLCPNMCRFDCPPVQASKKETHSPAVKARIAYFLEMNRLTKNEENILPLFEGCVHCSSCQISCPFDFAVGDLLEGVAADLFLEKKLPLKVIEFVERIRKFNGLYPKEKYQEADKVLKELTNGEIYYFPGCVTKGNNPKIIKTVKKIADKAAINLYSNVEEKLCCGSPSLYAGDLEKCREFAEHNINHFISSNIKSIICECPECANMLSNGYKKLGYKLDIPIFHVSEWIHLLIRNGQLKLKEENAKKLSLPLSFHDPCVLARKMQKSQFPNDVLKDYFKEAFKQLYTSKELTHCCGFGGLVNIVNPSLANAMAKQRLEEFSKEGIKTIITSCPTCWYAFMKNNEQLKFEIIDFLEVIMEISE